MIDGNIIARCVFSRDVSVGGIVASRVYNGVIIIDEGMSIQSYSDEKIHVGNFVALGGSGPIPLPKAVLKEMLNFLEVAISEKAQLESTKSLVRSGIEDLRQALEMINDSQ